MSTFDLKKFLINEGVTRVSRDRKRLLKEAEESGETAEIIYRGFTIHKNGNVTIDEYPYEEVESPYNYPSEETWTWYFDSNPWLMKSSELMYDTPYLVALPGAFDEQAEENAVAELDFKGKVYCFYLESDADELIYGPDDPEMRANLNTQLAGLGRNLREDRKRSLKESEENNENITTVRAGHQFEDVWGHGMPPEDIDIFRDEEDDMYLRGDIESWDEIEPGRYFIYSDAVGNEEDVEDYFGTDVNSVPWDYSFVVSSHSNPYDNEGFSLARVGRNLSEVRKPVTTKKQGSVKVANAVAQNSNAKRLARQDRRGDHPGFSDTGVRGQGRQAAAETKKEKTASFGSEHGLDSYQLQAKVDAINVSKPKVHPFRKMNNNLFRRKK